MKKRGTIILSALFVTILWSCSNTQEIVDNEMEISSFNLGDTTEIRMDDIVLCNDDIGLFIQFDSVLTDSRCPVDALCIWEGNAEAGFSITYNKELEKVKLNTNPKMETKKTAYGFAFELIELNPYPGSPNSETTPKSVKVVITKE